MNEYIACCGLDCEACEARLATIRDDDVMRARGAKLWSELNNAEITPEMINCVGCRIDGVKTPFCESFCPIRQCAQSREFKTCGECPELKTCGRVGMIIGNNPEAMERLTGWG